MELYVFNRQLEKIGIVDDYTSLIWAKRYNKIGDCEIYVQASEHNINLLMHGYYLQRSDDDMICRIKKIELDTDIEQGDYLIVTGYDVKDILNQRIIWYALNFDGTAEDYIRRIISDAFNMEVSETTQRQIRYFRLGDRKGFKERASEQVEHDNVGEKVQSICVANNYGYRIFREGINLIFDLYKGEDRSGAVVFSPEFDNLLSTKYIQDATSIKNVALVGGIGEGKDRITQTSSHEAGINRYEMFIDASSLTNTLTYGELIQMYPDGYISEISPTYIAYRVDNLDIMLVDNIQFNELKDIYIDGEICYVDDSGAHVIIQKDDKSLDELQREYPGEVLLYRIPNVIVANLTTSTIDPETGQPTTPAEDDKVTIANLIYDDYLLNKGYEEIAKYGIVTSFDGNIEPSTTFQYKQDYFLGDVVKVRNEYGIEANARIVEVIETYDENGYTMMPKFEFVEVN